MATIETDNPKIAIRICHMASLRIERLLGNES
jgi:hypothetical protein